MPPPFPPVATRFVLDAGGAFCATAPASPGGLRPLGGCAVSPAAARKGAAGAGGSAAAAAWALPQEARPASFSGNFDFLIDFGCEKAYTE
ncbi:hypothetical protein D3Z52_03075 [Clostridiaceae bacterium]|nr:hypothetical protein [Clostridiaceae bacterium]NBI81012.1 hypothetical protein [Clostridiaceae bacterium]